MSREVELSAFRLEGSTPADRIASLKERLKQDKNFSAPQTGEVNNHIHTIYSFSPYAPAEAAYGAWRSGLEAAGIVDHESVSGCEEILEAGAILGLPITTGCELRVNADGTELENRRINNPDSRGVFYMVFHGIPHNRYGDVDAFFAPIRKSRYNRMAKQAGILNEILKEKNLPSIDFEKDVLPLSMSKEGGSITERHILFALSKMLVETVGYGKPLVSFLQEEWKLSLSHSVAEYLCEPENPHIYYDILGVLKGYLVSKFYQNPDSQECISVQKAVDFANQVGAIPCYPYLGDVEDSPTGDKKKESFEDSWLDILFQALPKLGFKAVTYMPPRNTKKQLARVQYKCDRAGLMEISGVDINSSRQNFRCPEVGVPEFSHLNDNTWALIAHEYIVTQGGKGLFDSTGKIDKSQFKKRLNAYASVGRKMKGRIPEDVENIARSEGLWTN